MRDSRMNQAELRNLQTPLKEKYRQQPGRIGIDVKPEPNLLEAHRRFPAEQRTKL